MPRAMKIKYSVEHTEFDSIEFVRNRILDVTGKWPRNTKAADFCLNRMAFILEGGMGEDLKLKMMEEIKEFHKHYSTTEEVR